MKEKFSKNSQGKIFLSIEDYFEDEHSPDEILIEKEKIEGINEIESGYDLFYLWWGLVRYEPNTLFVCNFKDNDNLKIKQIKSKRVLTALFYRTIPVVLPWFFCHQTKLVYNEHK